MTAWTSFHLRVVTPLFSGDDPTPTATDSPIRVPSIRGALRYWFRAVAAGHGITDLDTLAAQETEIFGSTRKPSSIALRIAGRTRSQFAPEPDWVMGKDRKPLTGVTYLLGLGLWTPGNGPAAGMQRPFVRHGAKFTLDVKFGTSETTNARFLHAFRAWLLLGGLGARIRRGFGQLELINVTGKDLPGLWEPAYLARPTDRDSWQQTLDNEARIPELEEYDDHEWGDTRPSADELPAMPVLSPPWWGAAVRPGECTSVSRAFDEAGTQWRSFMLINKARPGLSTPEWKGAILGEDDRFPRGALGLPVTYHRRADRDTHQPEYNSVVQPADKYGRRASPVWIRPIQTAPGRWALMTHVFRCQLLPDNALIADGDAHDKPLTIPADQANQAWDAWLSTTPSNRARLPKDFYDTTPRN